MAEENSTKSTRKQQEYLLRALRRLPEQLVRDYGGGVAVLKAAQADMDETFEEAAEEWRSLQVAEANVKELNASTLRQALAGLARAPRGHLLVSIPYVVGAGLLTTVWFLPPALERFLAFQLMLFGFIWLVAPTLLSGLGGSTSRRSNRFRALDRLQDGLRRYQSVALASFFLGSLVYSLEFIRPSEISISLFGFACILVGGTLFSVREIIGRPLLERLTVALEGEAASRLAYEQQLRISTLGRLRARLSRPDSYGTDLRYRDYSGLAEMDDASREVPTATRDRLLRMMKLMPGGTIALAGSRGAGKSTLMRSVCGSPSTRAKEQNPLEVIVDAPVKYEGRDFVLHLFARLCTAVIGEDEVRRMRGTDRLLGPRSSSPEFLLADPQLLIGVVFVAAGLFLAAGGAFGVEVASPLGWGIILVTAGYLVAGARYWAGRRVGTSAGIGGDSSPADAMVQTAVQHLRQIWFQQSFSQGWSGGFKVPVGIEGGLSGSTELSEQQLSLPDIVDLFREFLGQVAGAREVRIGIDELDKMDDESARRFLNELKVVFRVSDCFFFLSISEEAMSHFERRGLHVRDVFDSSLDAVIQVPISGSRCLKNFSRGASSSCRFRSQPCCIAFPEACPET